MIAGAGAGAAKALEEILGEQMLRAQMAQRERENQERMALEQQRLAESTRQFNVRADADDRKRRDDNNRQGLELMQADKGEMDLNAAIEGLPAHLKPISGLMKVGALGKLSPDDLQSPEQREKALSADEQRQIRIRRASQAPSQAAEKKPMVVKMPDGSIKDLNNVLPDGAVPYDQVAARSSQPKDQAEAEDTAREASRLASELLKHKGFSRAFGTWDAVVPPIFSQDKADASSIRDALTSMLTLENMSKMKGVLSDSDMKVLRQASTTLNAQMSEGAAKQELERIVQVMGRVAGSEKESGQSAAGDELDALIERLRKPKGQ